jgi:hypothetical protein
VGDDRRRAVRPAGDHRQAAGHRLDEDEPERLGDGGQDERVGRVQRLGELLVRAPAGEEDLPVPDPLRRGERVLPLPLARMAADEYERRRPAKPRDSARVGADQERQALDRRVATDVEEDRAAAPEGRELLVTVGDAPRPAALVPAARLLDQPAAPKREPLVFRERSPREALELDAAREAAQLRPLEAEQEGSVRLRPGRHDQEGATPRPGSQPPAPSPSVPPAGRRSCLDPAQHGELGPVQLAQDRQRGEASCHSLVRGRQVVQMEQIGGARAGAPEQLDPGSDEPVVGGIVDGGKDAIGRIRAILVGGLEGNGRSQWLRKLERGRVVERVEVDPGEEAPRVGRLARLSERTRGERRLPACGRQGAGERARDLCRAAAGEEEERRDDESVRCRRAAGALRDAASIPNRLLPARLHSRQPIRRRVPKPLVLAANQVNSGV